MELRTKVNIEPSEYKISYNDPVMLIGSCFASYIGASIEMGRMPVLINPAGAVFNPVSVYNTLDNIISGKNFTQHDLRFHEGNWLSFYHNTEFNSDDPLKVTEKINRKSKEALDFLKKARFLFITLGTARVYRLKKTGEIVSNCHKIPSGQFQSELLTVNGIVVLWKKMIENLTRLFPLMRIVFTISPVRHWKDGAHGNQISKSILFLAVEELLNSFPSTQYFPAYELVMDDLRDYRFYSDDMLHPSDIAVKYIWEAFSECYLDSKTVQVYNEVARITKACSHRFKTDSQSGKHDFADRMLKQINDITADIPAIDLSIEKEYFQNLLLDS